MTGSVPDAPVATGALIDALLAREPAAARQRDRIRIVRAPGRVNLIGEHTDYNDGLVLPAAIDRDVRIAFVPTADGVVRLTSLASGDTAEFDLAEITPARGHWIDYVAGTAWALAQAGLATAGFAGVIASDLPAQAGLSSSAALELASAWALSGGDPPAGRGAPADGREPTAEAEPAADAAPADGAAPTADPMTVARAAQLGENGYVGVQCGLMDQFAATFGVAGAALRLDCRSLDWVAIPLPVNELVLVVCHSGAPRTLAGSAYNDRRAECARAVAEIVRIVGPDRRIDSLRDLDPLLLAAVRPELVAADPVAARRADHIVAEIERVDAVCAALAADDFGALGALFAASHESLRTSFEVSSGPLDTLVAIATATPGVVASRLTGAGFGGCTINLVRPDAVADLRAAVERDYERRTRLHPRVLVVAAADGAGPIAIDGVVAAR